MNIGLTVTKTAVGAIIGRRFVRHTKAADATNDDQHAKQAAAATDLIMGVSSPDIDVADGGRVDVHIEGLVPVDAGGVVPSGSHVTSDANGKAVVCAPAAGTTAQSAGTAFTAATAENDIILVHLARSQVTTPAAG